MHEYYCKVRTKHKCKAQTFQLTRIHCHSMCIVYMLVRCHTAHLEMKQMCYEHDQERIIRAHKKMGQKNKQKA